MLAQHLGASLAADTAASGVNYDWMQEFGDQATRLGVTFRPTIIGFGAVLDNLSAFIDNTDAPGRHRRRRGRVHRAVDLPRRRHHRSIRARPRDAHASDSSPASGVFFFRFLRLAVVQWVVYALLFGSLHRWLFDRLYPALTHEIDGRAHGVRWCASALYLVFGALVAACNMVFDYAKVRAVVEDRRSMLGAIAAAVRFIAPQRRGGRRAVPG